MGRVRHGMALGAIGLALTLGGTASAATAAGRLEAFPIPTPDSHPVDIVSGPDGNLWFAENAAAKIGRITPSGAITEFPTPGKHPIDITVGPDGALWFAEAEWAIGRITTAGAVTQFPLPPKNRPNSIATGSDGNLWITVPGRQFLRKMTPQGVLSKVPLPMPIGTPQSIKPGPDGDLWFTLRGIQKIGRVDPATEVVTEYALVNLYNPNQLTTGPDGNVWFTADNGLGSVTMDGQLTEYVAPTLSYLGDIVTGPDGNLWFIKAGARLGRIDPDQPGEITRFPLPDTASALAVGSDGRLWLTFSFDVNVVAALTI